MVANMVMEYIEDKPISTFNVKPKVYFRFVDDTIAIMKKMLIDQFHNHLNAQHSSIQFTVERYSPETGLAFLDSHNLVNKDGTVSVSVYRKKTHTDRYLIFGSHHPIQQKAAVVDTLCTRAIRIPSTQEGRREEQYKGFVSIPYIQGTSEKIKRVLQQHDLKVMLKPTRKLGDVVSRIKDNVVDEKETGVVYSIPCRDCSVQYIGQTGRAFLTRKKEHISSVKNFIREQSALAERSYNLDHRIDWDKASILLQESREQQQKWEEAWEIAKTDGAIAKRDRGRVLPDSYIPLLSKYN